MEYRITYLTSQAKFFAFLLNKKNENLTLAMVKWWLKPMYLFLKAALKNIKTSENWNYLACQEL